MTSAQIILFVLMGLLFFMLIWGRFRYDLVAFSALLIALVVGVVPVEQAFSGFGHPATVVIAFVLIISRGLSNSGVVEYVAGRLISTGRSLLMHISLMSAISAGLSALMNNVAALALLMPVDLQAADKEKRSPAMTLMPLSFASILGGMITLIGTPPNIIISAFREKSLGEPYAMFDFAPVGAACAVLGILFIAVIGWRLIPAERSRHDTGKELLDLEGYIAELAITPGSSVIDQRLGDLDPFAEEFDAQFLGVFRFAQRLPGLARRTVLQEGDVLVIEAIPEKIEKLRAALKLEFVSTEPGSDLLNRSDLEMREVVVPDGARATGRMANVLSVLKRNGVSLLGLSRRGSRFRERLRLQQIQPGDLLLLLGSADSLAEVSQRLGVLPLAERGLAVLQREKALLAISIFAAAIILASFGVVYLTVALGCVVALYVLFGIVPLREIYTSVEWSVIVLLAALIPIGTALETSGGTALIAGTIVSLSAGYSAVVVLTILMIVTMTLSDVMNNTATAVIAAPIAIDIATTLQVSPDPFLMAVAVAASCAFLTPIGHKNNTLIMGAGGYRFGDYWRMGLPLEILVVGVGVPTILIFWPL
ncbi:MAG: SLC13 family permease [Pseudomonadota bacterium]|nr:SLC13 family permease [Pseudomonadota bacterium]